MKKYKILLPILSLAAVLTAAAAIFAPGFFQDYFLGRESEQSKPAFTLAASTYTPALAHSGHLDFPPFQSDIDNVFYTVKPASGAVAFYEYTGAALIPYSGIVKTAEITANCSNQDIPVKLYYIEQSGKVTGCGLFTTAISAQAVKIYEYAFFKITDLPAAYGKSGQLLLVDFDKNNFWVSDKLYTEAFILSLEDNTPKAKKLTTNDSRTIDLKGAFRSDWVLLYDDFIESLGDKAYFLSSRDYNLDQKGLVADILTIADPKPPRTVTGILGLWARVTAKGLTYLRATETGFDCVVLEGKDEKVFKSFTGDYFKDYLINGNFLLNKTSLVLTDLLTGAEKTLTGIQPGTLTFLSVSPGGKRVVLAAAGAGEVPAQAMQKLVFHNIVTGETKTFEEPLLFSQTNANFCWADENTLFHLRPTNDDGTGLGYCFIKMS
jgi:hypothetical protein